MTDILKCDLCDADAGDDPYHATMDENGHVHICAACFDPQQHDVGVLWMQRDKLLAELKATESRLHEVSTFCATIWQQRDELLAAVQYAADVFSGYVDTHKAMGDMGAEAQGNQQHLQVMLDAIAKAGGE